MLRFFHIEETDSVSGEYVPTFSLLSVSKGSIDLVFGVEPGIEETNDLMITRLSTNSFEGFSEQVCSSVDNFYKILQEPHRPIYAELFSKAGNVSVIDPTGWDYSPKEYETINYLYGELTDVGGANVTNIHLRNSIFGTITCKASKEQAILLAPKLYTKIGVRCKFSWIQGRNKPSKSEVLEILPYDETKWDENIQHLQELFSNQFKDSDPESFFKEFRGTE